MTHHFRIDSRAAARNANSCWSIRGDLWEPALDSRVSLDCLSRSSMSHRRKRECVLQSASIDPIESSTFLHQLLWLKRVTSSISCLRFSSFCCLWGMKTAASYRKLEVGLHWWPFLSLLQEFAAAVGRWGRGTNAWWTTSSLRTPK